MRGWLLSLLVMATVAKADDTLLPVEQARRVAPVVGHLVAPESLRPCCAFGYDLNVRALGVPIPFTR